jgi:hypothetical protein
MPWSIHYHEGQVRRPEGLTYTFSSRTRTVAIDYAGKHFVYSDANDTLTIDGIAYPLANGPVYLRIALDGKVLRQPRFLP